MVFKHSIVLNFQSMKGDKPMSEGDIAEIEPNYDIQGKTYVIQRNKKGFSMN